MTSVGGVVRGFHVCVDDCVFVRGEGFNGESG